MPKFEDLTGQKFGHLTAIRSLGNNRWLWKCDCGTEKEITAAMVKCGKTASCSRSCKYSPAHALRNDLTGKRFGRLVVSERAERYKTNTGRRSTYYICQCDCGKTTTVTANHLTTGHTWSCGCAHKEQEKAFCTINLTHSRVRDRTPSKSYRRRQQIKQRCYNEKDISYPYYGAKGVKMWDGWIDNPAAFCEYVESLDGYDTEGSTIDRIDYTKDYEPGNLRWISLQEQQWNKSNNAWLTANGETRRVIEWAQALGVTRDTISQRIKRGWTPEEAVSTPSMQGKRLYKKAPAKQKQEQDIYAEQ